jgi:uncharacterized membrane protein YdfJ with MMPL/SSD domain
LSSTYSFGSEEASTVTGAAWFEKLAAATNRYAWWVVGAWVAAAVVLSVVAPSLATVGVQDDTDFLPKDAPSQRADALVQRLFPDDPKRDAAIVVVARDGGLRPEDHAWFAKWGAAASASKGVTRVQSSETDPRLAALLKSEDGAVELALVDLDIAPFTPHGHDLVGRLRAGLDDAPPGLDHHVTGLAGLAADQADAIQRSFDRTALVTLILVLAILVLIYRSAIAPLIPLASIGLAFLVSRGVVGILADHGLRVASLADTFMVLIVFGAGTDYCLFLVSRYREDLATGQGLPATLRRTGQVIGPVLAASAATVIVGFLALLVAQFGLFRTMGPALAIAVAVALAAGLTLTPALLAIAGKHAFWPTPMERVRQEPRTTSLAWQRLAATVRRQPAEVLLAGSIALLLPAAGLGWLRPSFDLVRELPAGVDSRAGFETLEHHFPGGRLSPVYVIVTAKGPILTDENTRAIDELTDELRSVDGVAEVRSITQPAGAPLTPEVATRLAKSGDAAALGLDPNKVDLGPLVAAMSRPGGLRFDATTLAAYPGLRDQIGSYFVGNDGQTTRLMVSLRGNPFDPAARDIFHKLDDITATTLAGGPLGGAKLALGGPSSFYVDIQDIASRDTRTMAVVLFAGIFLVLAVLLRSVVAPFYLLATILASFAATLGLTVIVFQGILGEPGISFLVTPLLFVILVALGADYNIFVTSRMREELAAGRSPHDAAAAGLAQTGKVITSAGLILSGTFAALVLAPMPNLRQMGFAVGAGILIDTFLVRATLVPAATVLLGRWAFWPGYQRDRAERLRPAHIRLAGGAIAVFAALLAIGLNAPQPSQTTDVATAATNTPATTQTNGRAGAVEAPTDAAPTSAPTAAAPTTTSPPATSTPASAPPTTAHAAQNTIRPPAPGQWRYHLEGTRRIGLAGSAEPFTEDVATTVERLAGGEVRARTSSSAGDEDDRRAYGPNTIELRSMQRSGAGMTVGGTLQPPQALLRFPSSVGTTWSGDWTAGTIHGHSTAKVTAQRTAQVAGQATPCTEVTIDTTFDGDAKGRQHSVTCWSATLGMPVTATEDFSGTYNGVTFDIRSTRTLTSPPR